MFARLSGATEMLDRAERVASTLTAASAESATQIEVLSQRTNDAVALREAIGTISHEVTASREVVAGELRRMRDDLFWLTDRGERISAQAHRASGFSGGVLTGTARADRCGLARPRRIVGVDATGLW